MKNDNFICADTLGTKDLMDENVHTISQLKLQQDGWVLLRGFNAGIHSFSHLVSHFCSKMTFDPAREYGNKSTQKVDAGTGAIGLHIENGNTPFPPDIVGFYSKRSATQGSQTTLCDGVNVFNALSDELKQRFMQTVTVSRTLPENLWKNYAANEHPALSNADEVDATHLEEILSIVPNHRGQLKNDGSLHYELDINPVISSQLSDKKAFANAILGPSINYEPPHYTFADSSEISDQLKDHLADLAEQFTIEIPWQDGDIALIDNKRVMHGRRAIIDHENREIFIGMGLI